MKTTNKSREGVALPAVMIIALIISIMGVGLFSYSTQRGIASLRKLNTARSFWAAEGGFEYMKSIISRGDNCLEPDDLIRIANLDNSTEFGTSSNYFGKFVFNIAPSTSDPDNRRFAIFGTGTGPSNEKITIGTIAWAVPLANGWGMKKAGTWDMDSTTASTNSETAIGWGGPNRIMGPYYSGDGLRISINDKSIDDEGASLTFGGEVTAYNFYDSKSRIGPDDMTTDTDNNGNLNALTDEILEPLLKNGYVRSLGADNYDETLLLTFDDYRKYAGTDSVILGNSIDEAGTADNEVYEIEFLEDGTYRYRKCTAYLIADAIQGLQDYVDGNPMKLDTDKSGGSDGTSGGAYASEADILAAIEAGGTIADLNVFMDWGFETNEVWQSGKSIKEGLVINVNGDALVHGVVNGKVAVISEKNIFIGSQGLIYESAKNSIGSISWQDWYLSKGRLGDLAENNRVDEEEMYTFIEDNIDDVCGLVTRHQVIALSDPKNSTDLNLHANVVISEDVDTAFGKGFDVRLNSIDSGYEIRLGEDTFELLEQAGGEKTVYYGKKDAGNAWGTIMTEAELNALSAKKKRRALKELSIIPDEEAVYWWQEAGGTIKVISQTEYDSGKYDSKKGEMQLNGGNPFTDLMANPVDYLCAINSDAGQGIPDYFYKQYCTVGLHPWALRKSYSRDNDYELGDFNFFGAMSEYRHSRFNPGGPGGNKSGMKRKFLYDWRVLMGGMVPPNIKYEKWKYHKWVVIDRNNKSS